MANEGHPVYCGNCGSLVQASDRFCGVCGARIPSDAPDAANTREIPTLVTPPPRATLERGRNNRLALMAGIGAVVIVLLVIGTIIFTSLTGGQSPPRGQANPAHQGGVKPVPPATTQRTNSSPPDRTYKKGTTKSNAPASPGPENLSVGDSAEARGVKATLNGLRLLPKTEMDQPIENPNNEFLAADMTFENTSDRPVSLSSLLEITLKDENGYSASQTIHTRQKQLSEGNIAPGDNTSGEIVYEVPPDATGLRLEYSPFGGSQTYIWRVGDLAGIPSLTQAGSTQPGATNSASPSSIPPGDLKAGAEQAAGDYYRASGRGDWDYTYDHLDATTQSGFTRDEWFKKNQWFADNGQPIYHITSVNVDSSSRPPVAEVTLRLTYPDGTTSTRTTYFVHENGGWKHRFGQEEIDLFMPNLSFEKFVEAHGGTTSGSV